MESGESKRSSSIKIVPTPSKEIIKIFRQILQKRFRRRRPKMTESTSSDKIFGFGPLK